MKSSRPRVKKHTQKIDEVLRAAKETNPCVDCYTKYPYYVMQFDHARGDKKFNISKANGRSVGLDNLIAELLKCDLVCANCHAKRTYARMVERQTHWT